MVDETDYLSEDDPRLVFQTLEVASIPPKGLIEHLKDCWWSVHPVKGLVWYCIPEPRRKATLEKASAQCNSQESITRRIAQQMYPWAEVKFVPSVFRQINPRDYV